MVLPIGFMKKNLLSLELTIGVRIVKNWPTSVLMDSLSKVYNKKVFSIMKITKNDTIKTYIAYAKDDKLTYELISSKRLN